MINTLQNICEEISLPNGGFICVMDKNGELLAHPDIASLPLTSSGLPVKCPPKYE